MDRKRFFDAVRNAPFPGMLTDEQVAGMTQILDAFTAAGWRTAWAAYGLSTVFHETGGHMQPVIETRRANENENPPVDVAIRRLESSWRSGRMPWVKTAYWRKDSDGLSWLGRGLPQTTHKANYLWAERKTGIPFTRNPDLMLKMEHSLPVMIRAMEEGAYTGKANRHYLNGPVPDYVGARRIINGTDQASLIAGQARAFERALDLAGYAPAGKPMERPTLPAPPPPDIPAPEPPQPARGGFWSRFVTALFRRMKG